MRFLPVLIQLGLMVFALVHCIQAGDAVRHLPRWAWIVLIVLVPYAGAIAYLWIGRPVGGAGRPAPWPMPGAPASPAYGRAPRGPDDDPDFLASLRDSDTTHEQMLKDWEDQLREREERLREPDEEHEDGQPS
ncbi:MAG TPA: PLD nuclease N-terminal domain-containing protein [Actinotalea sp.]|nr:PLD nuclease N-terminal domain-containing protein [Actinotalea sp.]